MRMGKNNLPMSILWLFESPDGAEMIVSSPIQVGQGLYQLFEVDTPVPIYRSASQTSAMPKRA